MGAVAISYSEKRLLQHLRMGGSPGDAVGKQLVWNFSKRMATEPTIAPILQRYGITVQDLAELYLRALEHLMPRPWMNVGGPMLVPTQWFMEPHRLENLLAQASVEAQGQSRDTWLRVLIAKSCQVAEQTREIHDMHYGPPQIEVLNAGGLPSAQGCLGSLLAALVLILAVVCTR